MFFAAFHAICDTVSCDFPVASEVENTWQHNNYNYAGVDIENTYYWDIV